MTKHRTITGFVAVALLAVTATAATIKSHAPRTDGIAVAGTDALPAKDFSDRWSAISDLPPATDAAGRAADAR
ncbi:MULTISPECIES: hypothetical protein [Bradyrhizobium]|jgi:hypothetical protein|uniref:hypothetical protein n=1 Tax=Bradyrhizobium TaxID=374 RepID=UPI0004807F88|nr:MULTISPECIES: hypothetical protein [Bradyrhizobium]MCS3449112.1 hypothetical protein [Bradyrhizobium elkanii]MCS3559745.1 hypothetical protein [Bradyrhizobium elkanii]MCW2150409.1 hypothetical protein [Bradyrhizobium elkanii]MCW2359533.1 hypothetical protein [Bradyrhizobium elkanii]MCW2374140.1 hypothetical protein [Bradyrhizobium elkanii]